MKRRTFTKITALGTLAASFPLSAFETVQGIPTEELLGKGNPYLTKGSDYNLRPEAAIAFEKMKKAAALDDIQLKTVSSYRNYAHQNRIWEGKFKRFRESGLSPTQAISKIIEYSTIPGTSRHHWGTDIDIIDGSKNVTGDVLVPSKFHGTGPFCAFKEWMDSHCEEFGFYLVYTDKTDRKGFKYEPWHYSYAALSKNYLKAYQKLDIKKMLQEGNLMGSDHFTEAFIGDYISRNILDINPSLLP